MTPAYKVVVGAGLLARAGGFLRPHVTRNRVVIVTDPIVAPLHAVPLTAALAQDGIEAQTLLVPPGGAAKRFGELERLARALLRAQVERSDLICALGGGSVGDLAGLAASLVRRGVRLVHAPTTLLAQVDSSIGGKTGIDTDLGKNLIGSFYQPRLVLADTGALDTLPARAIRSGYAEIVKYALIGDHAFFAWLDENLESIMARDPAALMTAVSKSVEAKARITARDPHETLGERALLNLGHTFGHALETAAGDDALLTHGEAVAMGLVMAFDFSAALGLCPPEDARRVRAHIRRAGLAVSPAALTPRPDPGHLLTLMEQDKKVSSGRLTFILARGIGRAEICRDPPRAALEALLERGLAAE